jgi:hypothetical protein
MCFVCWFCKLYCFSACISANLKPSKWFFNLWVVNLFWSYFFVHLSFCSWRLIFMVESPGCQSEMMSDNHSSKAIRFWKLHLLVIRFILRFKQTFSTFILWVLSFLLMDWWNMVQALMIMDTKMHDLMYVYTSVAWVMYLTLHDCFLSYNIVWTG